MWRAKRLRRRGVSSGKCSGVYVQSLRRHSHKPLLVRNAVWCGNVDEKRVGSRVQSVRLRWHFDWRQKNYGQLSFFIPARHCHCFLLQRDKSFYILSSFKSRPHHSGHTGLSLALRWISSTLSVSVALSVSLSLFLYPLSLSHTIATATSSFHRDDFGLWGVRRNAGNRAIYVHV